MLATFILCMYVLLCASIATHDPSILLVCKLKGCSKPVHQDETRICDYCCLSHYKKDIYKGQLSLPMYQ